MYQEVPEHNSSTEHSITSITRIRTSMSQFLSSRSTATTMIRRGYAYAGLL